jgi:hypothetical protein
MPTSKFSKKSQRDALAFGLLRLTARVRLLIYVVVCNKTVRR